MDAKGRFTKGNRSGGRPKQPEAFRELVRQSSPTALKKVISILHDSSAAHRDVLAVARLILEYAWGKPAQSVEASVEQVMRGDFVLDLTREKDAGAEDDAADD